MKITFTELEESERRHFEEALGAHELSFVHSLAEVMPDTDVLSVFISSRITDAFLARHPALRLIATRSTTVDHLDLESCARRGVAWRPSPVTAITSWPSTPSRSCSRSRGGCARRCASM